MTGLLLFVFLVCVWFLVGRWSYRTLTRYWCKGSPGTPAKVGLAVLCWGWPLMGLVCALVTYAVETSRGSDPDA